MTTAAERHLTSHRPYTARLGVPGHAPVTLGLPNANAAMPGARPQWERRYALLLALLDSFLLLLVFAAAALLTPFHPVPPVAGATSLGIVAGIALGWIATLAVMGAYESRLLGQGPEEYKRVFTSTWHFAAFLVISTYALRIPLARGFLVVALPVGLVALLAGHHLARSVVARLRVTGKALHRVLVVGPAFAAAEAIREMNAKGTGFTVVGVSTSGLIEDGACGDAPVLDGFGDVLAAVQRTGADTVAVIGTADMPTGFLRELSWQLEGTGVDLMLSPAITDVAGPRVHVRPVARLAMLYLEEPQLRGAARFGKALLDRTLAAAMLLVLMPLLLVIGTLIRVTSPGATFFRQRRAGLHGDYFGIWKFRTMHVQPEQLCDHYDIAAELSPLGSKTYDDPRVTRLGRFLRVTSLDELPQLFNVLVGQMSLVGPRPLRQHEVESFADHELRRHLVKPGMTGLWQVSGRSDIGWEERVRLDLYYVENWSPLLDLAILMRTIGVVLRRQGAY